MGKSGKKGQKAGDVNAMSMHELDEILNSTKSQDAAEGTATTTQNASGLMVYFVISAVAVAALPIYLFSSSMFGLDIAENVIFFAVGTIVAAVALVLCYQSSANAEIERIAKARKANRKKNAAQPSAALEACAWSLFYNNILFLFWFLAFAFYLLPKMVEAPAVVTYLVSTAGPAVLMAAVSNGVF